MASFFKLGAPGCFDVSVQKQVYLDPGWSVDVGLPGFLKPFIEATSILYCS